MGTGTDGLRRLAEQTAARAAQAENSPRTRPARPACETEISVRNCGFPPIPRAATAPCACQKRVSYPQKTPELIARCAALTGAAGGLPND